MTVPRVVRGTRLGGSIMSARATRLTALYAVIAAVLLWPLLASASTKPAGAQQVPQRFTIYSANIANKDAPMLAEASGPISGVGLVTAAAAPGNTAPLTLRLPKGKVFVS